MKKQLVLAVSALLCGFSANASELTTALQKYDGLKANMAERSYELETKSVMMDEATDFVIRQQANGEAQIVSENGGEPSEELLEEFDPSTMYDVDTDDIAFILPDSGYELVAESDHDMTYDFQPVFLDKGKPHRAGRHLAGQIVIDKQCECIAEYRFSNTNPFRKGAIKFIHVEEHWEFDTSDWRPVAAKGSFEGSLMLMDVTFEETSGWSYQ